MTTKGCLGAIACPPSLLNMSRAKEEDQLHLIHFESDRLCSWKPGPQQMRDCCTSFTCITNEIASYKGHFGPDEHDYSHWMALNLPKGSIALRVLLFIRPEVVFFCCIAELAIKPCRSSRSKLRGEFGIPKHLQNRKQKHKATKNTKQTKDKKPASVGM